MTPELIALLIRVGLQIALPNAPKLAESLGDLAATGANLALIAAGIAREDLSGLSEAELTARLAAIRPRDPASLVAEGRAAVLAPAVPTIETR